MIYFASFHSITKYGIIFWSNSTGKIAFQLRNKTVRIAVETKSRILCKPKSRISCQPVRRAMGILTPTSSIYTIFNGFLVHNLEYLIFNFSVHIISTRKKVQLQSYQRGYVLCKLNHYQNPLQN